jgi:hypothetical protein
MATNLATNFELARTSPPPNHRMQATAGGLKGRWVRRARVCLPRLMQDVSRQVGMQSVRLAIILAAFITGCTAGVDCLRYAPAQVDISGMLSREVFSGSPNYEDIAAGDEAETYWVLTLENDACIETGSADFQPGRDKVKRIQLLLNANQYSTYHHLIGQRV